MDGLNPLARLMSWITRPWIAYLDHPFAREVLSLITRSPRSNLARRTEPLGRSGAQCRPSWPYAARPIFIPSGTLDTPLSCLEQALGDPHHVPKRCTFSAGIV
ncbi:UNVERIFIED_CONTAM: hypothetical protein Sradi_2351200 [Sesamum radiatum]|uniref:Uncharacterized protein n=1 Tax=Sesamum radiatum TaxID=300843 RepID=A0AAW2T5T3_SESRA